MGNTKHDSATDVAPNLISRDTADIPKTKEVTATLTGEEQLPGENGSSSSRNRPNSLPGSVKPLQAIAPAALNVPAVSESSISPSSHLPSTPGAPSSTSLSSRGTSSVPMSDLTSSKHGTAAPSTSSGAIAQVLNQQFNSDADADDAAFDTQEEQDAVEQAGEGSIIVDSDDVATDAGYESDNHTAASTSLAESIRDYIYENGRRYHRFREGRYNFPNDDVE